MSETYWALAAGCVPDALPWDIPRIACSAGFRSSGMWVDPATTWDSDALARTREALAETGIGLVDVEVIWLEGDGEANDTQKLIVDVGLALGARNVLVVSRHENHDESVRQFRALCERVTGDIRINLEFGEFTSVKSLAAARAFIREVDHPAAGILIDLMHINRAGEELPKLDRGEFSYIQACDFWQSSGSRTGMDYIVAAVDERCPLGEGEAKTADIETVCRSGLDVSLEIRSRALREAFPDPYDRAAQIFSRCDRNSFC